MDKIHYKSMSVLAINPPINCLFGRNELFLHQNVVFEMKSSAEYMELLRLYFENTAKQYGVSRMGIFGSVARGEYNDNSDVDVVYEGQPNLFLRIRMKMDLEKL